MIKTSNSSLHFFNKQLKFFLNFYISCLRLRQSILIYFDPSETTLSKDSIENELNFFCNHLKNYYLNINYIIDFIPGFISNSFNNSLKVERPVFDIFFFLNYNPQNPKHVLLINDISTFRYEYVIFSAVSIDLFKVSPYSFVLFDLNDPFIFKFFIQILLNAFERSKLSIFENVEKVSILIFTILYLKKKINKNKRQKAVLTPKLFLEKMKEIFVLLPTKYKNNFIVFKNLKYLKLMKLYYYYFHLYFYKNVINKVN